MILSNTTNIRYKYKNGGMNTKEMAQLLKYYGFRGFLKAINKNSFTVAVLPEDKAHNRKAGGVNDTEEKIRKDEI